MIPASFVQDLLSRCNVVDVVGRHVTLKKAGINYKGLCPFHGEKTPSFIVSPTRQTYHCFGCGAHGDAIRFLTEQAGLGFVEAVKELAGEVGLQVPEDDRSAADRAKADTERTQRLRLGEALEKAMAHYREQLKRSPKAIDYLKARGLTGEIAARFRLGYAPAGWRTLASAFPHYDDPVLEESGLVIVQDAEDAAQAKRYDRFRDRIMFPIRGVRGDVIGFGARVIDGGEPKYLNSPETAVFVKGRELYGLFEARNALRDKGYVLVTEGYMDVVALAQLGLPNAVATLGTACTAEHVHKLLRFTERVVFSFDGDAAGRRAATRALEAALPHATDTRSFSFLFLPTEHDPDSFIRAHGTEAFEQAVKAALPLSRQLQEVAGDGCDLSTAEGRARMLAQARPLWSALPEGVLKAQVLEALAEAGTMASPQLAGLWKAPGPAARGRQTERSPETEPSMHSDTVRQADRRPRGTSGRAVRRPAAPTLLDRVLWLLLHRPSLWDELGSESQVLLAEQAMPYGDAFAWIERACHAGADGMADLEGWNEENDPPALALMTRIRGLLPPEEGADARQELALLMQRLELQAVEAELQLLFESGGELSAQAQARGRHLMSRQAALKRLGLSTDLPAAPN